MMDRSKVEQTKSAPEQGLMPGEKWKRQTGSMIRRWSSSQRWLRFAHEFQARYGSVSARFEPIKVRVRAEYTKSYAEIGQGQDYLTNLPNQLADEAGPDEQRPSPALERSSHAILDTRLKQLLAGILDIRIPNVKIYANQASDTVARKNAADAVTYQDKIFFRRGKYNPREPTGIALLGHELTHAAQARLENQTMPDQTRVNQETQEQEALINEARVLDHLRATSVQSEIPTTSPPGHPPLPWTGRTLMVQNRSRIKNEVAALETAPVSVGASLGSGYQVSPTAAGQSWSQAPPLAGPPTRSPSPGGNGGVQTSPIRTALSSREISSSPEGGISSNGPTPLTTQQLNLIKEEVYRDLMNRIRTEFERGG